MFKLSSQVIIRLGSKTTVRNCSVLDVHNSKSKTTDSSNFDDVTKKLKIRKDSGLLSGTLKSVFMPEKNENATITNDMSSILTAKDVDTLLRTAENPIIFRGHALKVMSVLSQWVSLKKVKLSDFEKDPRFIKLCRILGKRQIDEGGHWSDRVSEDLSTVVSITKDDEAARLIDNLTLSQMIKVMQALQQKGHRSPTVLRSIATNIVKLPETIDLKRSADLLFCMHGLNFMEPNLMHKICRDVIESLPNTKERVAPVLSIIRSLGAMRYRHEAALGALVAWVVQHRTLMEPGHLCSLLRALSNLNYWPPECEPIIEITHTLQENDMSVAHSWLEFVFSLLILDRAERRQLESVLQPDFTERLLTPGEIPVIARRKLMAIDAYVSLTYPGSPRLVEDVAVGVPILYTKTKQTFVNCVLDTFNSLVSAKTFMNKQCETGMGFIFDAEFVVDSKCHPVPLNKATERNDVHRIAVQCLDYHDLTQSTVVPLGFNDLYSRLLNLKGYKVLQIPYTEFNPRDKLVTRVKYIETKLKDLIAPRAGRAPCESASDTPTATPIVADIKRAV